MKDVLGIACLAFPKAIQTELHCVDVEIRGELTRGMSVVDTRATPSGPKNVHLGVSVDKVEVRDYIHSTLASTR